MNWTRFWNRVTRSTDRQEANVEEELAFHAEMKTRELADQGIEAEAARDEAMRALGNLTLVREQVRETWSFTWLTDAGTGLSIRGAQPRCRALVYRRSGAGARARYRCECHLL